MADFTGFYYDNIHSSTYNLVRVSGGNRYSENLFPSFKDETTELVGGNKTLYRGTSYQKQTFKIDVAFDNLTEELFREMRVWLDPSQVKAFRFDERPYKAYWAKLESSPKFDYVCFLEEDETGNMIRIYKGESELSFVAYDPMGYCSDDSTKMTLEGLKEADGYNWQSLDTYTPFLIKDDNIVEWGRESGLLNNMNDYNNFILTQEGDKVSAKPYVYSAKLYNPGDKDTDFELFIPLEETTEEEVYITIILNSGEHNIGTFSFSRKDLKENNSILIKTKNHSLVVIEPKGEKNEKNARYDLIDNTCSKWLKIPRKDSNLEMTITCGINFGQPQIKYSYLYY